jgi:uncharacterized protein
MANIGKYNTLEVIRKVDFGFYLDGREDGDILIPLRYAPESCKIGDKIDVFIYFDSEDRIIATTEKPYAIVGEFACLKAVSVNSIGAFLDWGLPKDLLVPFREQKQAMEEGKSYIVFIYIDTETNRIAASAKLGQFLNHEPVNYVPGDETDIMIIGESELGYKAVINNRHEGILYKNEVFSKLKKGQKLKAYIRKVREDGKIDLRTQRDGYEKVNDLTQAILQILRNHEGFIDITDNSPAEDIYRTFGVSKKTFKKAIGALYKSKLILIGDQGISII